MLEPVHRSSLLTASAHPLVAPTDSQWLDQFCSHFCLPRTGDLVSTVESLATAFSRLPYENLTKIIKRAATPNVIDARRTPGEVLTDHFRRRTGGTCLSLTATLLHLVRSLGVPAEPILADRRYGANTHCALIAWIESIPHLLDPGYLIVRPIPLNFTGTQRIATPFNELELTPLPGSDRVELRTIVQGRSTYRLTFKTSPADVEDFLHAWDQSFDWEMMSYPVLTAIRNGSQLYLQGNRFQVRASQEVTRIEISDEQLASRIVQEFGVDSTVVGRALQILG